MKDFHWTAEVYGQGRAIRRLLHYPEIIPLFIACDHGVNLYKHYPDDIFKSDSGIRNYFSWYAVNINEFDIQQKVKIHGIRHPWISYRRKMNYIQNIDAEGTIFFPYHNIPGYNTGGYSDEEAIEYLKSLPAAYKPITVSMHMHDLGGPRQKLYESSGFVVVTSGEASNPKFVDNFYSIIARNRFAISQGVGSQVFYLIEFGIPTQILPTNPYSISILNNEDLLPLEFSERNSEIENKFSAIPGQITEEQNQLTEYYLGFKYPDINKFSFVIWKNLAIIGIPWVLKKIINRLRRNFLPRTGMSV